MTSQDELTAHEILDLMKRIMSNLSGDNGREWLDIYTRVNRRENPWPKEEEEVSDTSRLGPPSRLFEAPAWKRFVVREQFYNKSGELKVYLRGFDPIFLDLIEEDIPAQNLVQRRLERSSRHQSILAALGEKKETKLAHIWSAIESGILDKKACYVFYVRDAEGTLWAFRLCFWDTNQTWRFLVSSIDSAGYVSPRWLILS